MSTLNKRGKPEENAAAVARTPKLHYDCAQCPAFCCSVYERVAVSDFDLERLALHFNLSLQEAEKQFTKQWEDERILKRKSDAVLGESCRFLDSQTRGCKIYEGRPEACREFPTQKRCPYFDLHQFEMRHQDDPSALPLITIDFREWKEKVKEKVKEVTEKVKTP